MTSLEGCSLALPTTEVTRSKIGLSAARSEIDVPALAQTYSALLFRVVHSILRSRTEAEDIVQDVFVRVLEHRNKLHEVKDMRVWLVRIAWNLALDRKRRIRPEQFDQGFAESLAAGNVPADQVIAEARQVQAVLREMDKLPKSERAILLLSALDELQTAQIAAILGRSESAARALLFRARTRLRQRLEKISPNVAGRSCT